MVVSGREGGGGSGLGHRGGGGNGQRKQNFFMMPLRKKFNRMVGPMGRSAVVEEWMRARAQRGIAYAFRHSPSPHAE